MPGTTVHKRTFVNCFTEATSRNHDLSVAPISRFLLVVRLRSRPVRLQLHDAPPRPPGLGDLRARSAQGRAEWLFTLLGARGTDLERGGLVRARGRPLLGSPSPIPRTHPRGDWSRTWTGRSLSPGISSGVLELVDITFCARSLTRDTRRRSATARGAMARERGARPSGSPPIR
jgi:hypothetical protein